MGEDQGEGPGVYGPHDWNVVLEPLGAERHKPLKAGLIIYVVG